MPTVEDLDRLQGILGRLAPLAQTRRGQLIRAEDWNTVVTALVELARALLAADPSGDVPVHAHDEQVQLSWLDARLRALLQEGPLGDPRSDARVAAVERRVQRADEQLGQVQESLGSLRERVGDVLTRDVARESDLTSVRLSVEGIADSRRDVLALRSSLDAIRADLGRALELGQALTVDGEPLDAQDLLGRLRRVEELREGLTRPDGALLDAAGIERRLAEHAAALVTLEQVEAALKRLRPRVTDAQIAGIRDEVLAATSASLDASIGSLRAEVAAGLEERLGDLDGRIAAGVAAATPGLREEVRAESTAALDEALAAAAVRTREEVDRRLAQELEAVRSTVDERVAAVRDEALSAAREQTAAAVAQGVEPLRESVVELTAAAEAAARTTEELRGHVAVVDQRFGEVDGRLAEVLERATATAAEQAADAVRRGLAEVQERLDASVAESVDRRVGESVERLREELRAVASESSEALRAELRKTVPATVERALTTLPDRFGRDFEQRGSLYEVLAKMVDQRLDERSRRR